MPPIVFKSGAVRPIFPPCRCDAVGRASWFSAAFCRIGPDKQEAAKERRDKKRDRRPPGQPPRRSPDAQGRSTDARAPSAASACPEQSARSAPLGAKTRIPATGFLTTLAFRQNLGRRRGKRSRKRKRDAAAASAQAPRPGPAPRIPLRPLRRRRARRALRARRVRGARCGATQAGLFWDWES